MDDETVADRAFAWFKSNLEDPSEAARQRALQWLDDPYGHIVAAAMGNAFANDLLNRAVHAVTDADLPHWDDPMLADQFMRGLLEGLWYGMSI